jgi:hypothetical protein
MMRPRDTSARPASGTPLNRQNLAVARLDAEWSKKPTTKPKLTAMPKRKLHPPPQAHPPPDSSATEPGEDESETEDESDDVRISRQRPPQG